jgi:anion-transporting  ArsA/GET3 family ATPase
VNELFGGWKKRADEVSAALRGPEVAYVLVTTPDPLCVREVLYFAERLRDQEMRRDAFVVNRVHPVYGRLPEPAEVAAAVAESDLSLGPHAAERLLLAAEHESRMGKLDHRNLAALEEALRDEQGGGSLRIDIPAFPYDIHDLAGLARISDVLAPAGAAALARAAGR